MKEKIKLILQLLFLFCVGALIYMGIEILWRGHTHWTMGVVGGICFVIIGLLNEGYNWQTPFWKQALIGTCVVVAIEFVAGVILNIILGLNIWDYSNIPFNLFGQICLPFTVLWYGLTMVAIVLDDYVRYWFLGQEKPRYYWK